mgnify:CR=1 FL=1
MRWFNVMFITKDLILFFMFENKYNFQSKTKCGLIE